jgi:protein O-GlcNAc transferase
MRSLPSKTLLLLCYFGAPLQLLFSQTPSALRQADTDYRAGVVALNSGDLKVAQEKFESVVRLEPRLEQGYSALGAILVREGEWPEGIRALEKALALKPGDNAAQLNLALAYSQTGAYAKAVPLFAKAEAGATAGGARLPAQITVLYAKSLASIGRTQAAIALLKEVAAPGQGSAQLHDDLGSLYAQRHDWPNAEHEFDQALRMDSGLASAHLHLGFVFQAEHKDGAVAEWARACALAPGDAAIAIVAGKALADAGQDDKAAPVLEHALQLDPHSTSAAYALALVYQRSNHVSEAADLFAKVVAAEPKNTAALINLGLALSQLHRAQEAVPYLLRATALEPSNLTAHQNLAAAYIQIDQVASAVQELRVAITLAPDSPKAHYDLGVAYKLQDDAADAIPQLEAAEKLDPTGYEAPYVLGLLYDQVARYDDAARQLQTSLQLHSQNGDGWSTLGSVYLKLGKLPEAAAALRNAAAQLPSQADPHLLLANVLVKQGDVSGAAAERKLAAGLMRAHMNRQRAEVATNSGKSLMASGKLDAAMVEFNNAVGFDPTYSEAHLALADALEKEGKAQEAAAERARAKSLETEAGGSVSPH